jgi:hypothetical protein
MFESKLNKGKANGYAALDGNVRVPIENSYVITGGTYASGTTTLNLSNGTSIVLNGYSTAKELNYFAEPSEQINVPPVVSVNNSIAIGDGAEALDVNMFVVGYNAGNNAANSGGSNFFGDSAGFESVNAFLSNFIGSSAGHQAIDAGYSNFFGYRAGYQSTGNNVNAFGYEAGVQNGINGVTIFSNSSLPSYADRAAALVAITIENGAASGNTYLYYNETTFTIEGVRL